MEPRAVASMHSVIAVNATPKDTPMATDEASAALAREGISADRRAPGLPAGSRSVPFRVMMFMAPLEPNVRKWRPPHLS